MDVNFFFINMFIVALRFVSAIMSLALSVLLFVYVSINAIDDEGNKRHGKNEIPEHASPVEDDVWSSYDAGDSSVAESVLNSSPQKEQAEKKHRLAIKKIII